jgi:hypothetical protein
VGDYTWNAGYAADWYWAKNAGKIKLMVQIVDQLQVAIVARLLQIM